MKYPALEGKFIIETCYGCYSDSGWCYSTFRENWEESIDYVNGLRNPEECRVVDSDGDVVYQGQSTAERGELTGGSVLDTLEVVIPNFLDTVTSELLAKTSEELEDYWFFKYDTSLTPEENLYTFHDMLSLYERSCTEWEDAKHGHGCIVERVRDKYLMPKINQFIADVLSSDSPDIVEYKQTWDVTYAMGGNLVTYPFIVTCPSKDMFNARHVVDLALKQLKKNGQWGISVTHAEATSEIEAVQPQNQKGK